MYEDLLNSPNFFCNRNFIKTKFNNSNVQIATPEEYRPNGNHNRLMKRALQDGTFVMKKSEESNAPLGEIASNNKTQFEFTNSVSLQSSEISNKKQTSKNSLTVDWEVITFDKQLVPVFYEIDQKIIVQEDTRLCIRAFNVETGYPKPLNMMFEKSCFEPLFNVHGETGILEFLVQPESDDKIVCQMLLDEILVGEILVVLKTESLKNNTELNLHFHKQQNWNQTECKLFFDCIGIFVNEKSNLYSITSRFEFFKNNKQYREELSSDNNNTIVHLYQKEVCENENSNSTFQIKVIDFANAKITKIDTGISTKCKVQKSLTDKKLVFYFGTLFALFDLEKGEIICKNQTPFPIETLEHFDNCIVAVLNTLNQQVVYCYCIDEPLKSGIIHLPVNITSNDLKLVFNKKLYVYENIKNMYCFEKNQLVKTNLLDAMGDSNLNVFFHCLKHGIKYETATLFHNTGYLKSVFYSMDTRVMYYYHKVNESLDILQLNTGLFESNVWEITQDENTLTCVETAHQKNKYSVFLV